MKIQFLIIWKEGNTWVLQKVIKTEMPPLMTAFHPKIKIESCKS